MGRFARVLCAFAGLVAASPVAFSQTSAPTSDGGDQLSEITVTAEKRAEPEQKTPISMSVFTAEEITKKGIVDFQTLAAQEPSLSFTQAGSEGSYLTIRGVSSHDVTEIGDPAVPVVVDGFTTIRPYTLTSVLYDVDRIEVLRGPQGTLYGRSATGGLINVSTKRPDNSFSGGGYVETGDFSMINTFGWLNIPLNNTFQVRVSATSRRHDGYVNAPSSDGVEGQRGDDEDSRSARFQLAFSPNDVFNGWLMYQITHIGGAGFVNKFIPFIPAAPTGNIYHGQIGVGSVSSFPLYGSASQDIDDKVVKWQFVYSGLPAGISITAIGGYDNLEFKHHAPAPTILGVPLTTALEGEQNEFPKTINQEIRVASDSAGPFIWQAGLYYFQERSTNLHSSATESPNSAAAQTLFDFLFPLVETKSRAAYGQASYAINNSNKITAGVRYSQDTKSRNGSFEIPIFGLYNLPDQGASKSSKTTWHVGYDWQATEQNLIYGKVDTGYKPGGFTTCGSYNPETVMTYEVGSKNRANDNRIQVNAAAFYNEYKDQQVSALSPSCASGTVVQNAGKSEIYGLELSAEALLTRLDKVTFNATFLHARFVDFVASPVLGNPAAANCANVVTTPYGLNCQLDGNTLTQAPTASLMAGYDHTWELPDDVGINFRVQGTYVTKQYFDPFNFGDSKQGGYGLVGSDLSYSKDKYKISLWGRNLANKQYLVQASEYAGGGASLYQYGFGAPRTFGVRFEASYQ